MKNTVDEMVPFLWEVQSKRNSPYQPVGLVDKQLLLTGRPLWRRNSTNTRAILKDDEQSKSFHLCDTIRFERNISFDDNSLVSLSFSLVYYRPVPFFPQIAHYHLFVHPLRLSIVVSFQSFVELGSFFQSQKRP